MKKLIQIKLGFILLINILFPCAVCYGDPESPMAKGMNMGVLTLVAFICFVLCMVAISIVMLSIKSKNINKLKG